MPPPGPICDSRLASVARSASLGLPVFPFGGIRLTDRSRKKQCGARIFPRWGQGLPISLIADWVATLAQQTWSVCSGLVGVRWLGHRSDWGRATFRAFGGCSTPDKQIGFPGSAVGVGSGRLGRGEGDWIDSRRGGMQDGWRHISGAKKAQTRRPPWADPS